MLFATDRDLLVLEPSLFTDVPLAAQELARTDDAAISGVTLASATAVFSAVSPGMVVVVNHTPLEVIARIDDHTLTVSRLRSDPNAPPIAPVPGEAIVAVIRTFGPQIRLAHDVLLRQIGVSPSTETAGERIKEEMVTSRASLAYLSSLGALARIFAGAAALSGDNESLWRKADSYQEKLRIESRALRIGIDLDLDGKPELWREPGAIPLLRA